MFKWFKKDKKEVMNLYQYKFVRYKREREEKFPLDIEKVHVPCEKDLITVVLPVYNGADVVRESIESVLRQTYENFEFIIINDGSKDNTLEIVQEYAKKDARIVVVDQENRKIPRTLSRGFAMAKGEFYTWTSADNIMPDNYLEKMVNDLKNSEKTGMIVGNMRLINEKGKIYKNHYWFEKPVGSGNVIFPEHTRELNTYPNNTVGAAFMYRAKTVSVLDCYSSYKHTLEDYDYWMRMNNFFEIKHTTFREPVYYYRWHSGSLTAKDAELGITKNRYKLMVLDDFRRDFNLTSLVWIVDGKNEEWMNCLSKAGQTVIDKNELTDLSLGKESVNLCYINFGEDAEISLPESAVKIFCGSKENAPEGYDFYIGDTAEIIGDRKWFAFDDTETMFGYVDAFSRNKLLYHLEGIIEGEKNYNKKLSVILCTNKEGETVDKAVEALLNQTADKEDYEIILVNNNYKNKELRDKYGAREDIKYLTAVASGLSNARNYGLWNAEGEFVLYVDDDAVADENLVKETIKAFEENEDFGVIGGNVILRAGEHDVLCEETRPLWSELVINSEKFKESKDYGEFPYGANFGVRKSALMQIGGFRASYGRVGENFAGGEETLVCFMMSDLSLKVGLNPKATVYHEVDESRFTKEHISRTAYEGIIAQYRLRRDLYAPQDWTDFYVNERAKKEKAIAMKFPENSPERLYHEALQRGFEDVLKFRQRDYEELKLN